MNGLVSFLIGLLQNQGPLITGPLRTKLLRTKLLRTKLLRTGPLRAGTPQDRAPQHRAPTEFCQAPLSCTAGSQGPSRVLRRGGPPGTLRSQRGPGAPACMGPASASECPCSPLDLDAPWRERERERGTRGDQIGSSGAL